MECALKSARKSSMGRMEWPSVRIVGCGGRCSGVFLFLERGLVSFIEYSWRPAEFECDYALIFIRMPRAVYDAARPLMNCAACKE